MKRPSKRAQATAHEMKEQGRRAYRAGAPRDLPQHLMPRFEGDSYGRYLADFWLAGWDEEREATQKAEAQ